eukprot:1147153-Pelagomonas_calceolata.AAC.3
MRPRAPGYPHLVEDIVNQGKMEITQPFDVKLVLETLKKQQNKIQSYDLWRRCRCVRAWGRPPARQPQQRCPPRGGCKMRRVRAYTLTCYLHGCTDDDWNMCFLPLLSPTQTSLCLPQENGRCSWVLMRRKDPPNRTTESLQACEGQEAPAYATPHKQQNHHAIHIIYSVPNWPWLPTGFEMDLVVA